MNLNKFMFASMILGGLSACSKDDVVSNDNGNGDSKGDAYMSLSISMPNSGMRSRSDKPEGDGTSEGTINEQKVKTLTVYVWGPKEQVTKEGEYVLNYVKTYTLNDLTAEVRPIEPAPGINDKITVYTTNAFKVKSGKSKVVAIVNGGKLFDESTMGEVGKTAFDVDKIRKEQSVDVETISTGENGFLMTNAFNIPCINKSGVEDLTTEATEDNKFNTDGTININIQGTKQNPTTVIIPVERAVAKLDEVSTQLTREVKGTKDHVRFTHIALINGNKKFFPIKKVRETEATNVSYIVDPNFSGQTSWGNQMEQKLKENFAPIKFRGEGDQTEAADLTWVELSTEDQTPSDVNQKNTDMFYTLENTMIQDEQNNAFTTGLYYKGIYILDGKQEGISVYRFQGKLYDWAGLQGAEGFPQELLTNLQTEQTTNPDKKEPSITDCEKYAIVKYENGICYYPYWIRHIDNLDNSKMGVMEFGVVRNNWYQMTLGDVSGIGTNKPVNPDPENPDEKEETMLEVVVKVLPWTVRSNKVDF